jgi:hypothetical protein
VGGRVELVRARLDDRRVLRVAHCLAELGFGAVDSLALTRFEQVGVRREPLVRRQQQPFGFDPRVELAPGFEILLAVIERVDEHRFDLFVGEPVARLHLDLLREPVESSRAVTWSKPFSSTSEFDLEPRHAGGHRWDALSEKRASERQLAASSRSPCTTWSSKPVWLSA